MAILRRHDAEYRFIGKDRTKAASKSVINNLERTQRKAQNLFRTLTGLSISGLAVGGAFLRVAKESSQFTTAIDELSAITGATGKDLQFLRKQSLEFGRTTTLSAAQSAEAFKLIASAKPDLLDNADALARVTKEAITLSEASGLVLPEAAKALGQSLNQFNADANESARFINVLAAGAKFGASEIQDTADALLKAGVVAKGAGVSFETTNAALQALAAGGIKGADAGTALRNILLRLQDQAKSEFNPAIVGVNTALENLANANLDASEKIELFGTRAFAAGQILLDSRDSIAELELKITDTDTATEQAAIKFDNLGGDVLRLRSAVSSLAIVYGSQLEPSFRAITQSLTNFTGLIEENRNAISATAQIIGVGGALYIGLAALPILITGITAASTAAAGLAGTLAVNWGAAAFGANALTASTVGLTAALRASAAATTANVIAAGVFLSGLSLVITAVAGFKIGEILSEKFQVVRLAGSALIAGLLKGFEFLQFGVKFAGNAIGIALLAPIDLIRKGYGELFDTLVSGLDKIPGIADETISGFRDLAASLKQPTAASLSLVSNLDGLKIILDRNIAAIDENIQAYFDYELATEAATIASNKQTEATNNQSEAEKLRAERLAALAKEQEKVFQDNLSDALNNSLTDGEQISALEKVYEARRSLIDANVQDEQLRADKILVLTEKLNSDIDAITGESAAQEKQNKLLESTQRQYARVIDFTRSAEVERLRVASEVSGLGALERESRELAFLDARTTLLQERERTNFETSLQALRDYHLARGELTSQFELERELLKSEHEARITQIELDNRTERQKFAELTTRKKVQTELSGLIQITQATAQQSRKIFEVNKALALSQAVVNLPAAVSGAYRHGATIGGPILGSVYGVIAAGAQLAQINAIRSTSFSGGGGGTTPSSAGTVPVVNGQAQGNLPDLSNQGTQTGNNVQIIVQGSLVGVDEDAALQLGEHLRDIINNNEFQLIDSNSAQAEQLANTG